MIPYSGVDLVDLLFFGTTIVTPPAGEGTVL